MALNYLQRVAASAVGTAAPAKPAATGPPPMPEIHAAPPRPVAASEPAASDADSGAVPEIPQARPVKADSPGPPAPIAEPLPDPKPARQSPSVELRSLRLEFLLRPKPEVIRTPPGLRNMARTSSLAGRLMPPVARPATSTGERASSNIAAPQSTVVTAAAPAQPVSVAPAAAVQPPPSPAVLPLPQPVAAMPNARVGKAESRIHIGRVEVQVNNRRTPSQAPKSTASASESDSLAARYLGRFLLRP